MGTAHGLPPSGNAVGAIRDGMMQNTTGVGANGTNGDCVGAERGVPGSRVSLSVHNPRDNARQLVIYQSIAATSDRES
jgi:hypothetical protein